MKRFKLHLPTLIFALGFVTLMVGLNLSPRITDPHNNGTELRYLRSHLYQYGWPSVGYSVLVENYGYSEPPPEVQTEMRSGRIVCYLSHQWAHSEAIIWDVIVPVLVLLVCCCGLEYWLRRSKMMQTA